MLANLVLLNGYVIEQISGSVSLQLDIAKALESEISKVYSQQMSLKSTGDTPGLKALYEPVARVHTLW